MEFFHSSGGNNSPWFAYRIKVKTVTSEAHRWCSEYQPDGSPHFKRFHVEYKHKHDGKFEVIQFESKEAAIMFSLKFGELLL